MKKLLFALAAAALFSSAHAEPKHVLVVTATWGFPHSSVPTAERVLAGLGEQSGLYTVDYVRGGKDKGTDDGIASKMSRDALKKYDAIIFANTTGELPMTEREALTDFVKSGKGFAAMHSGSDTFHEWRPYIDMLGGEFLTHHEQVRIDCVNEDLEHPATRHLGPIYSVYDEIYLFKNFDRTKVHGLLTLHKHPNLGIPGDYPVSWSKQYGKGRVFYTSLGHREDVWLSSAYQQHILGGIKFTLGLEKADSDPQDRTFEVAKEERRDGFKPLFNGKDLEGWKPRNKGARQSWSVQNGALVNTVEKDQHGTDLISEDKFKDFVIRYEYIVPKGSNSGLYLSGRHEIQIADDTDRKAPAPGSNGGLYNTAAPVMFASRKPGDWQEVEAQIKGNIVTVYMNGIKIHDKIVAYKATGSELDANLKDPGPIMLQGDHGAVAFRNIRIKKL